MIDLDRLRDLVGHHWSKEAIAQLARQVEQERYGNDIHNAFLRAKALDEAKSHWHPIKTAPKDGTWILVYDRNAKGQHVACWRTDCNDFVPEGWDGVSDTIDADFWMPLPEPPKAD